MNVINVATPSLACAVTVDGTLVGVFGSDHAQFQRDAAYIKSDFAIGPTDYPRLSKLVLYALMSHEVRLLLEQAASRRINSLFTRVFSAHPVSMKYRGLFDLTSREEQEDGSYRLSYRARAGQWSLAEGYRLWGDRHGNSN